jgi:phytoene desaturase
MRALSSEGPVIVIGAGLAGLSAALHLAGAGRQVIVVESRDGPGGLMGRIRRDGYTFDTGPTVLTMPTLIEDCLAAVGESVEDWISLMRLDPSYLTRFADGTVLRSYQDTDRMAEEIENVFGMRQAQGYRDLVHFLRRLFEVEYPAFMRTDLDHFSDLLRPQALTLLRLGALRGLDRRMAGFITDDRLRRMFTFQSLYAGVSPYQSRAIYAVIAYMDLLGGVWYPHGGMYKVAEALASAAAKHGVEFRFRTAATGITTTHGRVTGVRLHNDEHLAAEAAIVTSDPTVAYRDLLPPELARRSRALPGRRAPSAFVWHVGSSGSLGYDGHHVISFGQRWRESFRQILAEGALMSDPSILITQPSVDDSSVAPPGRHSYYVLVPCPNLTTGPLDWARIAPRYRDEVALELSHRGFDVHGAFSSGVEVSETISPADWRRAGMVAGTPFSLAHTVSQTGPLRHPTRHPTVPNLLFAGAGYQPGVGVPTFLLSGRSAAYRLLRSTPASG